MQIVPQDRDELLAQCRGRTFIEEARLKLCVKFFQLLAGGVGYRLRFEKFPLIAATVYCVENGQAGKEVPLIRVALFGGVDQAGSSFPSRVTKSSATSLKKPCMRSNGAKWVS